LPAAAEQQGVDERFREVTEKNYILTLLQSLVRRRVLVSVYLPGSDIQYISTVLSLDPQNDTLQLDELFPLSGHPLLEKTGQLRLFAQLGGAALGFSAALEAVEQEQGLYYFRLQMPESVRYLQRRDDHRVSVARLEIHVELYDHGGKVHKGLLCDISTGGISLNIAAADEKAFHENGVYRCTLHLPGEEPFHSKIDICCKRRSPQGEHILGASYVGLDTRSEHALRRVVAELERRLLRLRWEPAAVEEPQEPARQ